MVDDTSTWHQHRRRRRKNTSYPSAALLASLAAFVTPAVLARPVLLPFLYPSIPQSTSTSSSPRQQQQHPSPSRPRQKRSATPSSSTSSDRQPTATPSQAAASEGRRADRLANHFQPDDAGHFKPACWSLHGQSNCPRDDRANGAIDDPDVHEVVPGQPDFTPTSSTSGPSASVTPPTPTTTTSPTSTSTATAQPSATTVEPYTMTFNVSNIPPGWQKNARTSFYSKNLIIGFSVTLAALICLTIVMCVIWRIRVARGRRESERALKEKKRELGLASQTSDDSSSLDHDQDRESTRQRGLRRRRVNVRAGDEDDDDDDNDDGDDGQREGAAMSEKNGITPSGRKRRTAFMRTFSGKMLTGPTKWRRNKKRRQQEQEQEEEEEEDRTRLEEDEERDERSEQSGRRDTTATSIPPPLETQTSFSPLLAQSSTSTAVEAPIPLSPPPPPPLNLQPPSTTAPLRNGEDEEDDDVDPTAVQPPAYRRRNFGLRSRAAPAPTTATPMSARALEKQREAGDVPEEYMYMAGMMPPPLPSSTAVVANDASLVLERSRSVPVEQDRDEDDEEDGEEEAPRREDVSAHLATDDKTVLARLHESGSAPSAPPAELDALEEGGSHVMPVVPEEVEMYDLEDAQGSASGSSYPLPPPTTATSSSFLPAPPAITSAHLFVPPPPQSTEHEDGSELPRYVAGPSAPSFAGRSEKLSAPGPSEPPVPLPSAPPAEPDQAASAAAGLIVPSAPPMVEDGEVQESALVPSAPPMLEDEAGAGPSAPK